MIWDLLEIGMWVLIAYGLFIFFISTALSWYEKNFDKDA